MKLSAISGQLLAREHKNRRIGELKTSLRFFPSPFLRFFPRIYLAGNRSRSHGTITFIDPSLPPEFGLDLSG